jgi:hypothetical protein
LDYDFIHRHTMLTTEQEVTHLAHTPKVFILATTVSVNKSLRGITELTTLAAGVSYRIQASITYTDIEQAQISSLQASP